jgi:nitroreductase
MRRALEDAMDEPALTDHPVHVLVASRWSPYGFADRDVSEADLRSLFEAARWAPSSYNEQPWSYVVATRADREGFARLLSCLVEGNQAWARHVPVLALGIARERFTRNDKPNPAALHDLGLAAGGLLVEATARGIAVHQMIGILPDRARELYGIPDHSRALTGIAIGYAGAGAGLPEALRDRDRAPRTRKPLAAFVFGRRYGEPAELVADRERR